MFNVGLHASLQIIPLLAGYCIGLALNSKLAFAVSGVAFIGIFAYMIFNAPSLALIFAYFGHITLFAFIVGLLVGTLARIFANKGWALCTILITLFVFGGPTFYLLQIIESEKKLYQEELLAQEFVKNNPEVIAIAGKNFKVYTSVSYKKNGEKLPYRYVFSLHGIKMIKATVNVSRTSGYLTFALACIVPHTLKGVREPFKDICDNKLVP